MMLADKLLSGMGGEDKLYVDDVFSTYLYTGNGSTQTINNGIDLAGKGGLVWTKSRSNAYDPVCLDTVRGTTQQLYSSLTNAQSANPIYITSISSTGYSIGAATIINGSGSTFVSWAFRNADRFFTHTTVSHTNGTPTNISLSSLGEVGQVHAKITNTTGDWIVWHRSLTAGNNLRLNTTAAQSTTNAWLSVSDTTATLASAAPTGSYVIYAWAHDTSADGIIQCGSFTTDGSGNATVNLGWEPQFVLRKQASTSGNWVIADTMRSMDYSDTKQLTANTANAESSAGLAVIKPSASGFSVAGVGPSTTFIYLAIRRPNKPPKTGTEVFAAVSIPSAQNTNWTAPIQTDMVIPCERGGAGYNFCLSDRLRGDKYLQTSATSVEAAVTLSFDVQNGVRTTGAWYPNGNFAWFFRRAPGFFDIVCDTGTGAAHAINHNLTVASELIIRKSRSAATQWECWHSALAATEKLMLNNTAGKATDATAFGTLPTSTQFYVGASSNTNASAATYVTYLFATCQGVSKVFSFTGNGTSLPIDCGFTSGARFVLIKRTDSTGNWYVWDSTRGIVAANDPHLSLNTTAAEVTTDDSVDPAATGFIVNQNTATNINVSGASYIFLAIA